ncbi:hypothetical protein KR222_008686, partial [Zaprionus bogoriensis]
IWKTLNIQKSYKLHYIKIMLIALIFLPAVSILRAYCPLEIQHKQTFNQVNIDNLDIMRSEFSKLELPSNDPLEEKVYFTPPDEPFERIVKLAASRLNLKGCTGVADSKEMVRLMEKSNYLAGIEFYVDEINNTELPQGLDYTLRFPPILRTSPDYLQPLLWSTDLLFGLEPWIRTKAVPTNHCGVPPGYLEEGFVQLQHAIAISYLELKAEDMDTTLNVSLNKFPSRRMIVDLQALHVKNFLIVAILFAYAFPSYAAVKAITDEDERGIIDMMNIKILNWCAWLLILFILQTFTTLLVLIVLELSWADYTVFTYCKNFHIFCFLLCYVCASSSFILMISVAVIRVSKNAKYVLPLRLITLVPFAFVNKRYSELPIKLFACLSLDTALAMGFNIIMDFESHGEKLTWENFSLSHFAGDNFSVMHAAIMLLVDSVLYMLILIYYNYKNPPEAATLKEIDNNTLTRHWYYPINYYHIPESSSTLLYSSSSEYIGFNDDLFENSHGIKVVNVSKIVGYTKYLENVSMNIHPKEITVLLGQHNEARRLLTHIIAGRVTPTSGYVLVNNHDVKQYKGTDTLCSILPIDSIIFTQLTCTENMYFFMHLRGMRNYRQIVREIEKYLCMLKMDLEFAEDLADDLTVGMARCLSLCCALCGGNHAVIVDNPSVGLDNESRYRIWDMLKEAARTRVIIVNTKYYDEAEILGNRIAVLHNGKLQCYDRLSTLREAYCNKYTLHAEIAPDKEALYLEIVNLIRNHFSSESAVRYIAHLGKIEVSVNAYKEVQLVELLEDLEKEKKRFEIKNMWVRRSDLRDTFSYDYTNYNKNLNLQKLEELIRLCFNSNLKEKKELKRKCQQFCALMIMKMILLKRYIWVPIILLFIVTGSVFMNLQNSNVKNLERMNLTFGSYRDTAILMKQDNDLVAPMFNYYVVENYVLSHSIVQQRYKSRTHELTVLSGRREIEPYLLYLDMLSALSVETFYVAAADVGVDDIICYWNNNLLHAAPISLNLLHNALALRTLGTESEINVSNYPLGFSNKLKLRMLHRHTTLSFGIGNAVVIALCIVVSVMVLPLNSELPTGNKRLYLSGNTGSLYWSTQVLMDAIIYTVTIIYLMVLLIVHDKFINYEHPNYDDPTLLVVMVFILVLFGMAALSFAYLFATYLRKALHAFLVVLIILCCSCTALVVIFPLRFGTISEIVRYLAVWSPSYQMYRSMRRVHINAAFRRACRELKGCRNEAACCNIKGFIDYEFPGIFNEAVCLLLQYVIFSTLLAFLINYPFCIEDIFSRKKKIPPKKVQFEENRNVLHERELVNDMQSEELIKLPLVVKSLGNGKNLQDISFFVKPGEVFGIVGPSNSGKTDIIDLIIGERRINYGEIFVAGVNVHYFLMDSYHYIGHCPRENTLLDFMTVRELLRFYCIEDGCQRKYVPQITNTLCSYLGLTQYLDVLSKKLDYSDRRKLSVAISILCNKKIILLDEPTRGMSTKSQIELWPLIHLLKMIGRAVVLTTNSIDEAITVCDCIAILSKGELQNIGSIDRLSSQTSPGHTLVIRRVKVVYSRNT